jgi:major type 1 subunit fimbrin (pilin)
MKMKSLCLAMIMLGLSSSAVFAADGTLKFVGNIGNSSCQVTGGENVEITVPMGTVPVETLKKNAEGPAVGFAITLQNCQKGTYYLVLDGVSPSGEPNVLALDRAGAAGIAEGVGIKIKDISDKDVTLSKTLDLENDAKVEITNDDGSGTFYLKANYYAYDQGELEPGVADATATFTIINQ